MSFKSPQNIPSTFTEAAKLNNTLRCDTRFQILKELNDGPKTLRQLKQNFTLHQSTVYEHLRFLINADIVSFSVRKGIAIYEFEKMNTPMWYRLCLTHTWNTAEKLKKENNLH